MFELFGVTLTEFEHFLLVYSRVAALMSVLVIFSGKNVNEPFKILLSLVVAFLCNGIVPPAKGLPVSFMLLLPLAAKEVLVGLALGLVGNILIEIMQFAGHMISQAMGLAMLQLVDPMSDEELDAIGQMLYMFSILLIFAVNGHHFFFRSIFDSFYLIPISQANWDPSLLKFFTGMVVKIFVLGLKISAPLVGVLFVEKVMLALFAKVSPEMDVFIMSLGLGVLAGLYMFTFYWSYFAHYLNIVLEIIKQDSLTFMKILGS